VQEDQWRSGGGWPEVQEQEGAEETKELAEMIEWESAQGH
jgi:hypothetical protein